MAIRASAETLRAMVHSYLLTIAPDGATDEEIFTKLTTRGIVPPGTKDSTIRARRIELVQDRLVRDSGLERRTRSGRTAVVWIAEDARPL